MRLECTTDATPSTSSNIEMESSSGSCDTSSTDDSDYEEMLNITPATKRIKRDLNLSTVAAFYDRTGVSDRTATSIVSATLKDVGIVTKENCTNVIDKNKIRRERSKERKRNIENDKNEDEFVGLYFNGRKDQTFVQIKKGGKISRQTSVEEHITLLSEPGSKYIGHVTPSSGHSSDITEEILSFLDSNHINKDEIKAIGCDGTVVNTGSKNGVIALIEQALGRPLQWIVCQLHANELPLRHLIIKLDGKTTGPLGFTGNIGKQLKDCEHLPIMKFEPIDAEPLPIDTEDLSTDQKYLLHAYQAVSTGVCSTSLQHWNPGKLAHSRWLTTANRILRLYMATKNPVENLKILVKYIMLIYVPIWFKTKRHPSIDKALKRLHEMVVKSNQFEKNIQEIIFPVIQRNAYYAHPENILINMIFDENKNVRQLGWRRIMKARSTSARCIREFKPPKINFKAESYFDMIDWQAASVTEPPLTKSITDDKLKEYIHTGDCPELSIIHSLPCHTQAVERMIKLVTNTSQLVTSSERRDGVIRTTLFSRRSMPKFASKKDFK